MRDRQPSGVRQRASLRWDRRSPRWAGRALDPRRSGEYPTRVSSSSSSSSSATDGRLAAADWTGDGSAVFARAPTRVGSSSSNPAGPATTGSGTTRGRGGGRSGGSVAYRAIGARRAAEEGAGETGGSGESPRSVCVRATGGLCGGGRTLGDVAPAPGVSLRRRSQLPPAMLAPSTRWDRGGATAKGSTPAGACSLGDGGRVAGARGASSTSGDGAQSSGLNAETSSGLPTDPCGGALRAGSTVSGGSTAGAGAAGADSTGGACASSSFTAGSRRSATRPSFARLAARRVLSASTIAHTRSVTTATETPQISGDAIRPLPVPVGFHLAHGSTTSRVHHARLAGGLGGLLGGRPRGASVGRASVPALGAGAEATDSAGRLSARSTCGTVERRSGSCCIAAAEAACASSPGISRSDQRRAPTTAARATIATPRTVAILDGAGPTPKRRTYCRACSLAARRRPGLGRGTGCVERATTSTQPRGSESSSGTGAPRASGRDACATSRELCAPLCCCPLTARHLGRSASRWRPAARRSRRGPDALPLRRAAHTPPHEAPASPPGSLPPP